MKKGKRFVRWNSWVSEIAPVRGKKGRMEQGETSTSGHHKEESGGDTDTSIRCKPFKPPRDHADNVERKRKRKKWL